MTGHMDCAVSLLLLATVLRWTGCTAVALHSVVVTAKPDSGVQVLAVDNFKHLHLCATAKFKSGGCY
jgi:hypothetical protein